MAPTTFQVVATVLFGLAILHTFSIKLFEHLALKFPEGSVAENLFHLLGEVEVVFGIWAAILVIFIAFHRGWDGAVAFVQSRDFTEPAFVFVIMAVASTRPILQLSSVIIMQLARLLPVSRAVAFFFVMLTIGPLLGSCITEPAAMTVTALLLKDSFCRKEASNRVLYVSLAVLFVNVSIGGTLTHFAAPPVLLVADKWHWDTPYMFLHFGWKALVAMSVNAGLAAFFLRKELGELGRLAPVELEPQATREGEYPRRAPTVLVLIHVAFLAFIVFNARHASMFMAALLFFLGLVSVTREYQGPVQLEEPLLVAFFLAGLVVLGGPQDWWLQPLISHLKEGTLFLGATGLTAITDNAALTYLGSQVQGISPGMQYSLVAGAVAGGGLTVIANAPNPAGFGILQSSFGEEGINPVWLLLAALLPTLIAMASFWLLPG